MTYKILKIVLVSISLLSLNIIETQALDQNIPDSNQGVQKNDAEAVKWLLKAAEQGNVHAQYNLGVMYQNGQGVQKDDIKAAKWYLKAAEQGHAQAQYNLGVIYQNSRGAQQ